MNCSGKNIPVSETTLQRKASEIPLRNNVKIFQANKWWLESFRTRHNINFCFLSCESWAVDMSTVGDWKSKLRRVIKWMHIFRSI